MIKFGRMYFDDQGIYIPIKKVGNNSLKGIMYDIEDERWTIENDLLADESEFWGPGDMFNVEELKKYTSFRSLIRFIFNNL